VLYREVEVPGKGVRLQPDGHAVDEPRAQIVPFAFDFIDAGNTLGGLSEELYQRGVSSPSGKKR
jgi:hypothetical protein